MTIETLSALLVETDSTSQNEPPQCSLKPLYRTILTKTIKNDSFKLLKKLQERIKSTSSSIGTGKLISKKMRTKLINWIEKLSLETFQFSYKTLILAIRILDEYLCLTNEAPSSLQLIGCSCLYLAAKTSEIVIVAGQCYVTASSNIFTEKQLLNKELQIFKALNYNTTFSCTIKVYKYMKQKNQCQNLNNYISKDIEPILYQTVKNIQFAQFRTIQIISMLIAYVETYHQLPNNGKLLQILKQHSIY